jgi:hypothetical protein
LAKLLVPNAARGMQGNERAPDAAAVLHLSFSHLAQFMCWELYIVIPPLQLHTIECSSSSQLKRRHYLDRELLNNLFRELKWHYIRPPPPPPYCRACDAMIHMRALSLSQAAISRSTQCVSRLIVRRVRRRRAIIKPFWERQSKQVREKETFLRSFAVTLQIEGISAAREGSREY